MEWSDVKVKVEEEITDQDPIDDQGEFQSGSLGAVGDTVSPQMGFTDEQMETLQKQIAAFGVISKMLLHTYHLLVGQGSQKKRPRQRWTPTPPQKQTLEQIYGQGQGTPCKERIKEITQELQQHGEITERNTALLPVRNLISMTPPITSQRRK
ncbi:hypothetical protein ACFE04_025616 [Oxalis oulophora]